MLVHLAFIILGGREETRAINLDRLAQRVRRRRRRAARRAARLHVVGRRLRLPRRQPAAADRGRPPRGSERFYYSAQKAELERVLERGDRRTRARGLRAAPVHRRRPGRADARAPAPARPGPLPTLLPDPGTPFQLVHHDDVALALGRRHPRRRPPGAVQPRRRGDDHARRRRRRARLATRSRSRACWSDLAALGAGPAARAHARPVGQRRPRAGGHGHDARPAASCAGARSYDIARRRLRALVAVSTRVESGCAARCRRRCTTSAIGREHDDDRDIGRDPAAEQPGGEDREQRDVRTSPCVPRCAAGASRVGRERRRPPTRRRSGGARRGRRCRRPGRSAGRRGR